MKRAIELAYVLWRFDMWCAGFGSYDDIDWATKYRLLRPFKKPNRLMGCIVKLIIKSHNKKQGMDCCEKSDTD